MKFLRFALTLCLLPLFQSVTATGYHPYNWIENRKRMAVGEQERDLPVCMLKYHLEYQYVYEGEDDEQYLYVTRHKIILVNNDQAIHENNKIYISTGETGTIVELKARSIQSDGKIVEMDRTNIREVKDEEGSGYRIFAIDGVEKGSEIEYFFTLKLPARFFIREFFQFNMPVSLTSFKLQVPGNLKFAIKSYNGFPEVKTTEENDSLRVYEASAADIPAMQDEKFCKPSNRKMRVEFKLAYNTARGKGRLFTWADVSKRIYHSIYDLDKESRKEVDRLIKNINIKKSSSVTDKIARIEEYIKKGFYLQKGGADALEYIPAIIKNKYGDERGLTKLYATIFSALGINHELVVTISRNKVLFDGTLDTWNYLDDYFFYFPDNQLFLAPYFMQFRLGMIPAEFTATQGLFIKRVEVRNFETAIGDVRYIPPLPYNRNLSGLDIHIKIADGFTNSDITMTQSYSGYDATYFRSLYPLLENDKKTELLESLVKFIVQDAQINEVSVKNTELSFQDNQKPFTVHSLLNSASLIEHAGNRYIIKIGDMIGPQTELYQENKRTCPVENDFNRGYIRNITLEIPPGYSIRNPDDINMDVYAEDKGERVYSFVSTYTLDQNMLHIKIEEFYKKIFYPTDKFEDFRRVINAAADWNKIALIMVEK